MAEPHDRKAAAERIKALLTVSESRRDLTGERQRSAARLRSIARALEQMDETQRETLSADTSVTPSEDEKPGHR